MKIAKNKVQNSEFEALLKVKGISKKEFSKYSGIAYNTVAGWKKKGEVPAYALTILKQMPSRKKTVTAQELIDAGMPRGVLWNNQSDKKVPIDIFIVSILQKAYNDFVIDKLAEYFGKKSVLSALLLHKERVSNTLAMQVAKHLQELPKAS